MANTVTGGSLTQSARLLQIDTPLGPDVLVVRAVQGHEALSRLFEIDLDLASEDFDLKPESLLSRSVTLRILFNDTDERHVNGVISKFTLLATKDRLAHYHARIVPSLWYLTLTTNCCIFQDQTAPEIIEAVMRKYGVTNYRVNLTASYVKREYCVQYRETAYDFVSRLMEDEGIYYYFEHAAESHTLVLADGPSCHKASTLEPEVSWEPAGGDGFHSDSNYIQAWERTLQVRPTKWTQQDFQFRKPFSRLLNTVPTLSDSPGPDLEKFDYPGGFGALSDAEQLTRVRMEEEEAGIDTVRGQSTCRGFIPGYTFAVRDNFRDDQSGSFLLIECEYRIEQGGLYVGDGNGTQRYQNRFLAMPARTAFRSPRVTERPCISGPQTAFVTGPQGEEIYVDDYGRVKVQFHWDRDGRGNDTSSCWIRVAQSMAGKQWGAVQLPRVGHEVIVEFLEGDPDRPLITGQLYNADHTVPYALPDQKTKSTIKTRSYPGGGGFNEIRLEDKKGSEQIFIHAESDMDVRVKNDRREWIGRDRHVVLKRDDLSEITRDRHTRIQRNELREIGRDYHLKVAGKQAISVTGSQSLAVSGDVIQQFNGNQSTQVTGACYIKGMTVVVEAMAGLTIKVGASFVSINPTGIQISGPIVLINSGGSALNGNAGNVVSPMLPLAPTPADDGKPGEEGAVASSGQAATGGLSAPNIPWHDSKDAKNKDKKSWIEIELTDQHGQPVPGEPYRVTLPDGSTVAEGTVDDKGQARVDGIDPGNCKVTFPNRDKGSWKTK